MFHHNFILLFKPFRWLKLIKLPNFHSKKKKKHIIAEYGCGTLIMMLNSDAFCFIELSLIVDPLY